jgi:hypothetical protein
MTCSTVKCGEDATRTLRFRVESELCGTKRISHIELEYCGTHADMWLRLDEDAYEIYPENRKIGEVQV